MYKGNKIKRKMERKKEENKIWKKIKNNLNFGSAWLSRLEEQSRGDI